MQLTLRRLEFTDKSTCGEMDIDGAFAYHTLELPNVDGKPGSCIPQGTYKVAVAHSPHFQRDMPLIIGIPGRSEIEIHWGNFPDNTRGCILIGLEHNNPDEIEQTRLAFDDFWNRAELAMRAGECEITVIGGAQAPQNSSTV